MIEMSTRFKAIFILQLMLSRGGTICWSFPGVDPSLLCKKGGPPFTLHVDDFQGWNPLYYVSWCFQGVDPLLLCWWYPGVEPPLLYKLYWCFQGVDSLFFLYVDGIQEWNPPLLCKLMLSMGGLPFTLYADDIQGWNPIYYVSCSDAFKGGPPFTLYDDDFQGWNPLYYVSWCFQGVDTLLLYMLMISRGGTPFTM